MACALAPKTGGFRRLKRECRGHSHLPEDWGSRPEPCPELVEGLSKDVPQNVTLSFSEGSQIYRDV